MLKKNISGIFRPALKKLFYNRLVENIFYPAGSSQKINGETINIPFRFRHFYPAVYEVEKTNFIKQNCRPGTTAIDIGAHIGVFSVFLGRQVGNKGKVFSFEPAPFTFSILQKTIVLNHLENIVEIRQQAVSNSNKDITFYVHKDSIISNANSTSAHSTGETSVKAIKVNAVILDDLLGEITNVLSFIKIDAEGAELEILKGAKRIIEKYRPHMTLEVHPKNFEDPFQKQKEIFWFVRNLGYNVSRDGREIDENEFCGIGDYFEVFLIPSGNDPVNPG